MRGRSVWDSLNWSGGAPTARAAFVGAAQGALLCALAHAAAAGVAVALKASFGLAAPPAGADFAQAAAVVALSSILAAVVFGAPLLLALGRLGAGGALTFVLCGAAGGAGAEAFAAWTWPPFAFGLAAFLAWYGGACAAAIWWRVRASDARG